MKVDATLAPGSTGNRVLSAVSAPGAGAKSDQVEAKADPGSKAKGKGAAKVPALKADTGAKAVEPSMKSEAGAAAERAKK